MAVMKKTTNDKSKAEIVGVGEAFSIGIDLGDGFSQFTVYTTYDLRDDEPGVVN
jgi:hypothetical protein